ncbi:MAG TPA: protease modulator HflK [Polyangiaceae bacterium]
MRKLEVRSEIGRLAAPLARVVNALWQRMHWWVGAMGLLYAGSGFCIIRPDEVAVILRWGKLVGPTPALQQHGPGLLFAFPRPIDQVVRVQTKHISELTVTALAAGDGKVAPADVAPAASGEAAPAPGVVPENRNTLDPLSNGYALTGDRNIIHVEMIARYRVKDPGQWAFYGPETKQVLRVEIAAAMVRSLGEMGVDRVLADGRKTLIATAMRRAQLGLDKAHSGIELSSLELTRLAPPRALARDFEEVQSAFIDAETKRKNAQAFAQRVVPKAQADTDSALQSARAAAAIDLANAKGDADAFLALEDEYAANTSVVRERLYRDAVERALSAAEVRWVPPSEGGRNSGSLRISLGAPNAGPRAENAPAGLPGARSSEPTPTDGDE